MLRGTITDNAPVSRRVIVDCGRSATSGRFADGCGAGAGTVTADLSAGCGVEVSGLAAIVAPEAGCGVCRPACAVRGGAKCAGGCGVVSACFGVLGGCRVVSACFGVGGCGVVSACFGVGGCGVVSVCFGVGGCGVVSACFGVGGCGVVSVCFEAWSVAGDDPAIDVGEPCAVAAATGMPVAAGVAFVSFATGCKMTASSSFDMLSPRRIDVPPPARSNPSRAILI